MVLHNQRALAAADNDDDDDDDDAEACPTPSFPNTVYQHTAR